MAKRAEKRKKTRDRGLTGILFTAVLLLLCGTVLLRFLQSDPPAEPPVPQTEVPVTAADTGSADRDSSSEKTDAEGDGTESKAETPESAAAGQPSDVPAGTAAGPESEIHQDPPAQEKTNTTNTEYNEETYQLVTDMVFTMRNQGAAGMESVRALEEELKAADPALGELWTGIMEYWNYAGTELAVHTGGLPDGLPDDDSLCIAVLGFQLLYDGEMAPELEGRCEIALAGARKYPNAYLLVTGGGTAAGNRAATEAEVMAAWFAEQGVDPQRIIIEKNSMTTDQNAVFSCRILTEQYPQIREIAVVSSDYHVAMGCMLFTEAALLCRYHNGGEEPYRVVSNAAYATAGNEEYSNPKNFASYIWMMADPVY